VIVERRTVSLWPLNASPLKGGSARPGEPAAEQQPAGEVNFAVDALDAITSSYRDGRAGIISGEPAPTEEPLSEQSALDPAPTHPPTVPVTLASVASAAEVSANPAPVEDREVAPFWSRLFRSRPSTRGRHSPSDRSE
jgi:hypothetical protein